MSSQACFCVSCGALSCLTQHMVFVGFEGVIVGIWLAGLIGLGGLFHDTPGLGNNYSSVEIGKSEKKKKRIPSLFVLKPSLSDSLSVAWGGITVLD